MTFEQQIRAIEYPPGEDAALMDKAAEIASEADAFRTTVAAALPESWYADSPPEFRIQKMVEQWQKLHKREKEVADALRELRAGYTRRADGEGASIEWRAATDLARQELDATIAKLGLEETK